MFASVVSHMSSVEFCSQMPSATSTLHADKSSTKATTELPSVGLSFSALENPGRTFANVGDKGYNNTTGLSLELCNVSLSPSQHEPSCERVLNSTPVREVKHCLDFDESDCSLLRLPKMQCRCEPSADVDVNSCLSKVTVEADSVKGCLRKNVVFHSSMPVRVPQSQSNPDHFTTVTPVTQRSHKFLVCF